MGVRDLNLKEYVVSKLKERMTPDEAYGTLAERILGGVDSSEWARMKRDEEKKEQADEQKQKETTT